MGKKPHWTIYCHTHVASGRRYVGLTKKTMLFRWNQHVQNAKAKRGKGCAHFWAAIRLYGTDAFSHEVLEVCDTLEAANAAEIRWIEKLGTRNDGFNLMKGGIYVHPKERRNPWDRPEYRAARLGVPETLEHRQAIAASARRHPPDHIVCKVHGKVLNEDCHVVKRSASTHHGPRRECRACHKERMAFRKVVDGKRVFVRG